MKTTGCARGRFSACLLAVLLSLSPIANRDVEAAAGEAAGKGAHAADCGLEDGQIRTTLQRGLLESLAEDDIQRAATLTLAYLDASEARDDSPLDCALLRTRFERLEEVLSPLGTGARR